MHIESEELGQLEHDSAIQYRKSGVYIVSPDGDELKDTIDYRMSDMCLRDGIAWDWFPDQFDFGNGVTVQKTTARPEYKTVVNGTSLDLNQYIAEYGATDLSKLSLVRKHIKHEGWQKWEARWLSGTCPQEAVDVHLTWAVFTHKLPEFAYQRLRESIEDPSWELPNRGDYEIENDPWRYLSKTRILEFGEGYAIPKHP